MIRPRTQVLIWIALYALWLWVSASVHPTLVLNIVVTAVLLLFYITAVYLNTLVLVPKLFRRGKRAMYFVSLAAAMIALNFIALMLVRIAYGISEGFDTLGDYWHHYAIDLFGMAVHVAGAAVVVWWVRKK